jgi:hypothetical protein
MSAKLDLSSLPPEVRQKVEAGLAKLSPETRRQWEAQGSPLLAKLVSGLAGAQGSRRAPPPLPTAAKSPPTSAWRTPDRPARTATENVSPPREAPPAAGLIRRTPPWGHYNDTIAPGDRPGLVQRVLLGAAIAGVAVWLFR